MPLLTPEQCRKHCEVVDDSQDAQLLDLLASAEYAAAAYLNRVIHADQGVLDAAIDGYADAVAAAHGAYDTAIEQADAEQTTGDAYKAAAMREVAALKRATALRAAERSANGIVANGSVLAAIKMTLAHLYENREAVTTGAMAEVPMGATNLLRPYRLTQMP